MPSSPREAGTRHVRDLLTHAIGWQGISPAMVLYDERCELARELSAVYAQCLPGALEWNYDTADKCATMEALARMEAGGLVVLIQSTRFELDAFRLRIELFKRSLKVIEHPHLARMTSHQIPIYMDALAYDPAYLRGTGAGLKERIDRVQEAVIECRGSRLVFSNGLEPARLNVGDYRGMANVGGQFPIGEVITESVYLEDLNGTAHVFAFGDSSFSVNRPPRPITLTIESGRVENAQDSTEEFDRVLETIRADEGEVLVRELGLGLNRAFTATRIVDDIGSYERMCGIHLSLGAKHHIYKKPGIQKKRAKHHVDVFLKVSRFLLDEECVYRDGQWRLSPS